MTNIVVVDGFTMNPGDLDWSPLTHLLPCAIHERTLPDQVIERCLDAEIVVTNKVFFDRKVIERLPKLRYLGVSASGYNIIDLQVARQRGICVTNVPAYSTRSVAQMVFAHILRFTQEVDAHSSSVRAGGWSQSRDFCFWNSPLIELQGLTLGILGFGQIARAVAEIGRAFGMTVIFTLYRLCQDAPEWAEQVSLRTLFSRADFITLHCPLTPETKNIVNAETLALVKPSAFLVNTGRGPLVDEVALAEALNSGRLAGAGLDVLTQEPPPADHPLLTAANCAITPHIAWATQASRQRLLIAVADNIRAFISGHPQNQII